MRPLLLIVMLLVGQLAFANSVQLSINDLTDKVSRQNYQVLAKAKRVYQAKESIQEARGRMLPSLNLWRIVKIAVDPTSWVDSITDIAPFLVPANGFRLEQRQVLYSADRMGYRALWANEILTARSLYYKILIDQELLAVAQKTRKDFEEVYETVRARVSTGAEKPEIGREIEFQIIGLKEDERQLELLIKGSLDALSLSLGYPTKTKLSLKAVAMPNVGSLKKLSVDSLSTKALAQSPEIAQMNQLLKVIPLIQQEYNYSFFGGSSMSRGVRGGVFDHLPNADGLSLANGPARKIVATEASVLRTERTGIAETIKRQVKSAVDTYNSSVEFYSYHEKRLALSTENIEQIKIRISVGEKLDLPNFLQFIHSRNTALSTIVQARYRVLLAQDKIDRLVFAGAYGSKTPVQRAR